VCNIISLIKKEIMKAISINFTSKLLQIVMFKSKQETKSSTHAKRLSSVEIDSVQRKAFTGNFFAGPHSIFDPRILEVKNAE